MVRSMFAAFCMLMVWSGAGKADPHSATYLLSPGDVVMVSVWQEDSLRQEATVLPDGSITFPLAGRIDVAGLDVTAVENKWLPNSRNSSPTRMSALSSRASPATWSMYKAK